MSEPHRPSPEYARYLEARRADLAAMSGPDEVPDDRMDAICSAVTGAALAVASRPAATLADVVEIATIVANETEESDIDYDDLLMRGLLRAIFAVGRSSGLQPVGLEKQLG